MTLNSADKITLSNLRMEKAIQFLDDAESNLKDNRFMTAVNRAYYSVLNCIRALLVLDGINPESHASAVTLLSLHYIKTDLLPVDVIKGTRLLLSRRTDVDYGDFESIDHDDAEDSVKKARSIINRINQLRIDLIRQIQEG